jgi:folate-binding protein YgfZ
MTATYETLSSSPVFFRRSAGMARVEGPDRVTWLQGMVSNDVARLRSGSGCYAGALNARGRVLALMTVMADEDSLWLLMDADAAPAIAALDALLIMEDATVTDCSEDYVILSVLGKGASGLVAGAVGEGTVPGQTYDHHRSGTVRIVRGVFSLDLIVPVGEADEISAKLASSGAVEGTLDLWNLLTLEAGLPRYGMDVDENTVLPELGEQGIDYEKGCYIGQEVVAKIRYLGHVNRHLVGLTLDGEDAAEVGARVVNGEKEVGVVTRSVSSPGAGSVIALAYVKRGNQTPGTALVIVSDRGPRQAIVRDLPFVDHQLD